MSRSMGLQDHLLEVLKPGLQERSYQDQEYLIRQGEQGTYMLYIMQGQVEVLLRLPSHSHRSVWPLTYACFLSVWATLSTRCCQTAANEWPWPVNSVQSKPLRLLSLPDEPPS